MATTPDEVSTLSVKAARAAAGRGGRPRSTEAHQRILDAAAELLATEGYADLRLEHVAARAGVGKATIYRRWRHKEELAQELLATLAEPTAVVADVGDTRAELVAAVANPVRALTGTGFGPVMRALLSQIARPGVGDPLRATVVQARRDEVARVLERGRARGDLRPDLDTGIATEMLVGPVWFRLVFGGELSPAFAERVVASLWDGWAAPRG